MPLPQTALAPHRQARPLALAVALKMGAITLIALLVGCGHWPFEQQSPGPARPASKDCRARCDLQKTQCQQRQQTREQGCAQHYTSAKADYSLCRKAGNDNCRAPYTCLGADLGICQQEFEPCLSACSARGPQSLYVGTGTPTAAPAPPPEIAITPAPPPMLAPIPTPKVEKTPAPAPKANQPPPATPKVEKTGGAAG